MIPFGQDEMIKIDTAHASLITGLVKSNKPKTILEMGIGGGRSTDAILEGLDYNQQPFDYTLVDNWNDFGFVQPDAVTEKYGSRVKLVTSDEKAFVDACQDKFDFIMSDADHMRTDQWFEYVYDNLVADSGILCYHDVNMVDGQHFVNLRNIYYKAQERKLRYMLFNKNSIPGERCERGLMVIFKD